MPRTALVLEILIASPGDVPVERRILRECIDAWNAAHSKQRGCVLMPRMWELDSTPALGDRAQGFINQQIVDHCDALFGVFWSRLGTPTGVAASGTAEEIERMVAAKKPARLYFSTKSLPSDVDLAQLGALRAYKEDLREKGLIHEFDDVALWRQQLNLHLTRTVDELVAIDVGNKRAVEKLRRNAEIAQSVLISFHQAAAALRYVSDDSIDKKWNARITTHPDKESWARDQYTSRWAAVARAFTELRVAHATARTHFGEAKCQAFVGLEKLTSETEANQTVWLQNRRSFNELANRIVAVGDHVADEIGELEQLAETMLGPVARMDELDGLDGH